MLPKILGPNGRVVGEPCRLDGWNRRDCSYEGRGPGSAQCTLRTVISMETVWEFWIESLPRPPTMSTAGLSSRAASDESSASGSPGVEGSAMLKAQWDFDRRFTKGQLRNCKSMKRGKS